MKEFEDAPVPILLVDDLKENLMSLEAVLRSKNLELIQARSGTEALEILLKRDIALAILDVQMPEMDGFELAELIRGSERTKSIPIIFLTAGSTDRQRRFRGYEAGAVDFLLKPLEPDILRSKVVVFSDLYRQRQQIMRHSERLADFAQENLRLLKESRAAALALKEADMRKDEFLATLAHELRNPLAPIRNGLQILRMAPEGKRSEDVREMMDRQLTHLVRLIDDLLDVSRVSRGRIDLHKNKIALQDVLKAAIETSQPIIDTHQHHLETDIPDAPIWVDGDLTRLAQVVSNLLHNAAKYTLEGGHLSLRATTMGPMAEISVSDTGLGIDEDMLPQIFELFTQVERHLDRSHGGLGIGLALVKKLVEMHGGTATATSEGLGKGSTFTIRLPLAHGEQTDATPVSTEAKDAVKSLNVLVVDDNVDSAKTTSWMLELAGHVPTVVHDGPSAIEKARATKPDIILLDIGMPGMDGYEVCRILRSDDITKSITLIAQTGWGQESDRQRAFEAGFDYHITKPMSLEHLSELMTEAQHRPSPEAAL